MQTIAAGLMYHGAEDISDNDLSC